MRISDWSSGVCSSDLSLSCVHTHEPMPRGLFDKPRSRAMCGRGQGPLAGVRILDLTSVLMGPYATQIFADLGADVIKIEGPTGDTTRFLPPGQDASRGGMFLNVNRGKRSLALALKQPADRKSVV